MRTNAKLAATACAALTFTTAGVAATPAGADPLARFQNQELHWGRCLFPTSKGAAPSVCATVTVPRDWADPTEGSVLTVSISRAAATGDRLGTMLVNPGGPGGQGSSLAGQLAGLEPNLHQHYDLIGMDPRGTGTEGGKTPAQQGFRCTVPADQLPTAGLDARDRSPASIAAHQRTARATATACQRDPIAPYITTWQTAHDMDLIRALLHAPKLDYLGYSYGTWLGAKYASLFPSRTGKVVLDSSVNWEGRLQADFEEFPRIAQREFDQLYLPWAAREFGKQLGTTPAAVRRTWEQVRAYEAHKGISPDLYDRLFVGMGSPIQWLLTMLVLLPGAQGVHGGDPAHALDGVPAALRARIDAAARSTFGVPAAAVTPQRVAGAVDTTVPGTRYAVACGDQPTRSADWYRALSDVQGPQYPIDGWAYGITETCGYWHQQPRHPLPKLPPAVASHVLVVQGEFDPQTGYEQARAAVRAAPGVGMVSVDDAPYHGQYALTANPCVDGAVDTFLVAGSRPDRTVCPGLPLLGEHTVYPARGPVDDGKGPLAALPLVPDLLAGLRENVQELISRTESR